MNFNSIIKGKKCLNGINELNYKKNQWELAESEIRNCNKAGIQAGGYTWEKYTSKKLTENEEGEFYDLETEY